MSLRFLFASDSFKGSLSSKEIAKILTSCAKEVFPSCECKELYMADGGEGTVDAVLANIPSRKIKINVFNPLFYPIECSYGIYEGNKVIMEMSSASGLTLVEPRFRNPLFTSTYGTGQMIKHAIENSCRDISIAIGGSATNDGGMGAMRALGVRFFDIHGKELPGRGEDLINLHSIDLSNLDKRIYDCNFKVMCDVNNPLCGERGATHVFARQKGATDDIVLRLEEGMQNYNEIIKKEFGVDCNTIEGAGAAGGLGAALLVYLNAKLMRGIDCVMDIIDFDTHLKNCDIVISGEGSCDFQSCYGKLLQGVGTRAKKYNKPVIAIVGSMGKDALNIMDYGIDSIFTTVNAPMTLDYAMENAAELYEQAAKRVFRNIKSLYISSIPTV